MRRLLARLSRPARIVALTLTLSVLIAGMLIAASPSTAADAVYKLIGWNDLGMHCMGPNYSNFSILPPYNTVWAQLIVQGDKPQIVTDNVKVEYAVENNTYSAGKTNFWDNVYPLFGVNLAPNIGLKSKGMSGEMDAASDHFIVEGIPLTAYLDGSSPVPANWYPYNIGHLTAKDPTTGQVLAETRPVIPVSEEMHCEACHADGMQEGIATGNVETNILTLHDDEQGTHLMQNRPVLCQQCHADNALGVAGRPGVPNLSRAMHNRHKLDAGGDEPAALASDPDNLKPSATHEGTNNCYLCHPGTVTKCLRDVMYQKGLDCRDCHGNTAQVADPARRPWIDLPRCGNCHPAQYAESPNTRYRDSKGHGGMYCEACHGSPHAILPSTQPNDNIQNIALQGQAGTLSDCTVCHAKVPAGPGPHQSFGQTPTATVTRAPTPTQTATPPTGCANKKPAKPALLKPTKGQTISDTKAELDWAASKCAQTYNVTLRQGSTTGKVIATRTGLPKHQTTIRSLERGKTYYWQVEACNRSRCTLSDWWNFKIKRESKR